MPKKIRRYNGRANAARERVLAAAVQSGQISNETAKEIGGWEHAYYHLKLLSRKGFLRHEEKLWIPTERGRERVARLQLRSS